MSKPRARKFGGLTRGQSPDYYYLIHLPSRTVKVRSSTPEEMGFQFRLNVNVDTPDLIMRKSKTYMKEGSPYIRSLFQELSMDEALDTGVPLEQWAGQARGTV